MAILVSANADITWAKSYPHDHVFQIMSNGHYVVIFKDTGSGNLFYATSPDLGATWTTPVVFPGSPTPTSLQVVEVVSDTLYCWYGGATLQLYTTAYNTSTNVFGAHTTYTYSLYGISHYDLVDASYADGVWHVAVSFQKGTVRGLAVFQTPGFDGTLATTQIFVDLGYRHYGLNVLRCIAVSGYLYVAWYDTNAKKLYFAPIIRLPGTYNWSPANLELAASLTDISAVFDFVQEQDSTQTFVVNHDNLLYSARRSGTSTWGQFVPLNGQSVTAQLPSLYLDTDDLYVGFETQINQPNGETYFVKRSGSRFTLPIIVAGGSSSGYKVPVIGNGSALYQDTNHNLYFLPWSRFSAPHAPTGVAPVGYVNTLTPTITWISHPSAPTDPNKSHQVQTVRVSDSALMDDSGEVLGTGTSYSVPGGAGLAYNTQYKCQVREKDSLSALGAGTWGPWSTYAIFTPTRAAVPVIATVTSNGVTTGAFPATIGSNDLQAHVTYTQPDSDSTNYYKLVLYDTDDATILASTAPQPLGPPVVSGGNFDTLDWTPGVIVNGHVYHLAAQTADSTTGVWSESAHVQLTTSYTPPSPVSALTATVDSDEGTVTLNWSNPGDAATTLVEWQPYSETGNPLGWVTLSRGSLFNHLISLNQAPQTKSDYRVTVYDSLGIASTSESVLGVRLDNAFDTYGIWINDVNDPLNNKVYLGTVDNWDSLKRDRIYDGVEWVPKGASTPIISFGLTKYWVFGTSNALKAFIPAADLDSSGGIHYGADNRDMGLKLSDAHSTCLYRDRRMPIPVPVKFWAYEDQPNDDVNTDWACELHQCSYLGPLLFVGSLV